ncbi:MAG TPA: AraC family transcriptional regulator [Candidatus Polarisedimenticolia bacterium]|nr:AraC family transcriptional regulator [Candidatus Polarisedimenticolia bacterium]
MAKIAVDLEKALARRMLEGCPGRTTTRWLAQGEGWGVGDVICTFGPPDRPFEERRASVAIALVTAGTFQYRSAGGRELMTPGSLMLGNAGQSFECAHEHGPGDRCLSFHYDPDYFESLAMDAAGGSLAPRACGVRPGFRALRLPPLRPMSPLVARAQAGLTGMVNVSWEELSVEMAARTVQLAAGFTPSTRDVSPAATARVTRAVRRIERDPGDGLSLAALAREARLSPYHFLRTFQRLTGVTPHRYVLRMRLREAATRLAAEPVRVVDAAFDSGFGDVSNFNHAFRAEFGASPRGFRRTSRMSRSV